MNVIGNGLIARYARSLNAEGTVFCCGVSDSTETRESEFTRERDKLKSTPGIDVYVSTVCVHTEDTPYAAHKRSMEAAAKASGALVVRLPNVIPVAGYGNAKNMVRFFCDSVASGARITALNGASRFFLDCAGVTTGISRALETRTDVDVSGHPTPLPVRDVLAAVFRGMERSTEVIYSDGGTAQVIRNPVVVCSNAEALQSIKIYAMSRTLIE